MLIDGIIESGVFQAASGAVYGESDTKRVELQRIYLLNAAGITSSYLGYDVNALEGCTVIHGELMDVKIDIVALAAVKNAVIRIATLLQQEAGGNIGVNRAGDFGENRGYLNIVNYAPYLEPLSALRLVGKVAERDESGGDDAAGGGDDAAGGGV